jgi:hypothetical protein
MRGRRQQLITAERAHEPFAERTREQPRDPAGEIQGFRHENIELRDLMNFASPSPDASSVRTTAGITHDTDTPVPRSSRCTASDSPTTACLVAQ